MDIKQLQFLCALEHHRHFGKAAEACCVTQPTLSMRLKNLEEELGVSLIQRKQRFEGLTEEGERLLSWAKLAVSAYDGMKAEAARLKGTLVGTLRIGMVPQSHVSLMPLLNKLREQAPQIRYELHALSSEQVFQQLENNTLDVGLSYLEQSFLSPRETERYQVLPFGKPDLGLLYHPNYFAFDRDDTITWAELNALPLGLINRSMRFRQGIDRSAQLQAVELTPIIESDNVEHLIEAASVGLCCTLIPIAEKETANAWQDQNIVQQTLHPALKIIPMSSSQTQASLALICRNSLTSNTDDAGNDLALSLMQLAKEFLVSSSATND